MNQIIDELSNVRFSDSDELNPESFFYRFKEHYEEYPRHKYSEISKVVYRFNDDSIDVLRINLSTIKHIAYDRDDPETATKIEKLIDHADLAENQRKLMEDVSKETEVFMKGLQSMLEKTRKELIDTKKETLEAKEELENTKEQITYAQKNLKETREELQGNYKKTKSEIEELQKDKSNIYTQFVTILGIFSAIIFASFGGLEILRNVLGNIGSTPTAKLLVFSSFSIAGIMSLLFVLFNGLSKLTGKGIRSCSCEKKGIDCKHTIFSKHPTIMVVGFLLFYTSIIGAFGYIVDYEKVFNLYSIPGILKDGSRFTFVLFLLIAPLAFYVLFYRMRRRDKNMEAS
ncbi:coiled-coil domain-containing protein [Oceanobacillus alkalisoli]|uniref:coiled-coil domain-containing protein n=1 Tax=Oceanobacillus alkalisoli TaxID=2925113 RepID=UPI001F121CD4|nr:centromere protein H [Oceanobacillus alkalisoli]MCF3941556.1 centromere protein H [Oceanobacillus alkalisoli]